MMKLNRLSRISDTDLHHLAKIYENILWAPYVVSLVHLAIKLKNAEKYRDYYNFYSYHDCWKTDGTIIVLMGSSELFCFTLDETGNTLKKAFECCDFSNTVHIFALHEKHISIVNEIFFNKNYHIDRHVDCRMYVIPPTEASKLQIDCPPEVVIKKLDKSATEKINNQWPHRFPGSDKYIETLIEMNGGYGVFDKKTNELAAWIIKHCFGHLGMLQTDESYKKRGYGSLITKVLSKEIGDEGHWPFGTIVENNQVSLHMFKKLGFFDIGMATYVAYKPNQ